MTDKYDRSPNARREFEVLRHRSEARGRSEVLIRCPFDRTEFWARIWSISGGGKRCPGCGAIHGSLGQASPTVKWQAAQP